MKSSENKYKPNPVKIGFLLRRGNIEKEAAPYFEIISVEAELQGIDLYKICSAKKENH